MKILKITGFIVLILAIVVIAILGFRLLNGPEDAWICQNGQWVKRGNPSAPRPTAACGQATDGITSTSTWQAEIEVFTPQSGQIIKSPLTVAGQVRGNWFFEASFPIKLADNQGLEVAASYAQSIGNWMTEDFVPYSGELKFQVDATTTGQLILKNDNLSGLPQYDKEIMIPVLISPAPAFTVKAFFSNANLDPEFSCNRAFPVTRSTAKTEAVARAALEQLLSGPSELEKKLGFITSINAGVKIQKLTIENGTAKVDFDEAMEKGIGGSCRVSAIRAQITETLKQSPTVNNVIISVNGRTEDILQP